MDRLAEVRYTGVSGRVDWGRGNVPRYMAVADPGRADQYQAARID